MHRRTFLRALSSTGATLALRNLPAFAALPKMKITRVRAYLPPNPNPLFNQSDMVVTVETDAGITGIGEGGSKDTLAPVGGQADRPGPAVHRAALAGHEPRLLLSRRPREEPTPSARSTWRSGTSRAKSSACRCTSCWAAWCATIASATTPPASFPGSRPA